MEKSKYEKPAARNLDAVQPVLGSCLSGFGEILGGHCTPGASAVEDCLTGSQVLPFTSCLSGDSAGMSCSTGNIAG